jgi:hypothetical protein
MYFLDDNLFVQGAGGTEASDGLGEEDRELLKSLEKMASEIDSEGYNSN